MTALRPAARWLSQPVPGRPDTGTLALALGICALALAGYAAAFGDVRGFVTAMDHGDELFLDFRRHYFPQGQQIGADGTPVFGYFYSAFFALLLTPLGTLELERATLVWGAAKGR